jgi:hypothetical protein
MKAIVVILVRTYDVKLLARQPFAVSISGSFQGVAVSGADKKHRADKRTIRNEPVPPFWTWFIENPRPVSRSFGGLVELTPAAWGARPTT